MYWLFGQALTRTYQTGTRTFNEKSIANTARDISLVTPDARVLLLIPSVLEGTGSQAIIVKKRGTAIMRVMRMKAIYEYLCRYSQSCFCSNVHRRWTKAARRNSYESSFIRCSSFLRVVCAFISVAISLSLIVDTNLSNTLDYPFVWRVRVVTSSLEVH